MENMPNVKKLTLNENSISNLEIIRKWSLFFSILGFIWMGFMVLMMIGLSFVPFGIPGANAMGPGKYAMIPAIVIVLVMCALYFFPILYLYKFSNYSKIAIKNLDTESADLAFKYLKMHFQFIGILTIIVLGLYLLFGIIAGIGAAVM